MIKYIIPIKNYTKEYFQSILAKQKIDINESNVLMVDDEEVNQPPTIFKKYNAGVEFFKKDISEDTIFVFMHDDITILDKSFESKLKMVFAKDKLTMVTGVIGTKLYNPIRNGYGWWMNDRHIHGHGKIVQGNNGRPYVMTEIESRFTNKAILVDGCIMAVRSTFFENFKFDEETFTGFHHYDNDLCLDVISKGFNVSIADIEVMHDSEGPLSDSYFENGARLVEKWKDRFEWPLIKK